MESSNVADILERAADLIEPEGAWIGGPVDDAPWARNAKGRSVNFRDAGACQFCLYGALYASAGSERLSFPAQDVLASVIGSSFLAMWNHASGRTQAEVVAKLREAAAKARGQQS